MNLKIFLFISFILFIGCGDSNSDKAGAPSINNKETKNKSEINAAASSYSKYSKMLREYEEILDELASLMPAVEANDIGALSRVTLISEKAISWVEKWESMLAQSELSSDEIKNLVKEYERLLKKYKELY